MDIIIKSHKYGEKLVKVNKCDFKTIEGINWCVHKASTTFYAAYSFRVNGKTKTIRMHRLIMGVINSDVIIDHKDGDGLNNLRRNLRKCSIRQNACNTSSRKGSSSKFKGVNWCKREKKVESLY